MSGSHRAAAQTAANNPANKAKTATVNHLLGEVSNVDTNFAEITVTHPTEGKLCVKLTLSPLRTSCGLGKIVEQVDDLLSIWDQVVVNIKEKTKRKWTVTRIWHCTDERPQCYDDFEDYTSKKLPAAWPKPPLCHVPHHRTGDIVTVLFDVLRKWNKCPVDVLLDVVCRDAVDPDGLFDKYIKTSKALCSFLRTVPQYFYVDHASRVCMYEGFHPEDFKADLAYICQTFPRGRRECSLDYVQIIQNVRQSYSVLLPMLEHAERKARKGQHPGLVVALDCEGVDLGRTGDLTLVQIAKMNGLVYIFDVQKCPSIFTDGLLADFLESSSVLKVIHDCRSDAAALYHQFGVTLTNIFDTSIAFHLLQDQCAIDGASIRGRINFKDLCQIVGEEATHKDKKFLKKMRYIYRFWAKRPLTQDMINYAALDVHLLLPNIYRTLDRLIHVHWRNVFKVQCEDAIQRQMEDY
ncbi:uncharacterized protein [Diadema setosum]|uniref:uncharacterized protein n=1 Tax=Diadema setosum TaxID=31175 RepID=UPI003B3B2433